MRAVIQRVERAEVAVQGETIAAIARGLVVLLGVGSGDGEDDAQRLAERTAHLRIFEDQAGKLNLSALQVQAQVLVVSQFTLYGDTTRGRRPSFTRAADPARGEALYHRYVTALREQGLAVATGEFGARMKVALVNDGPVTILMDTEQAL